MKTDRGMFHVKQGEPVTSDWGLGRNIQVASLPVTFSQTSSHRLSVQHLSGWHRLP